MIDSAEKRKSVAGLPFFLFLGVTPNAAPDAEWRQQVGYSYSGIAAAAPGGPSSVPVCYMHLTQQGIS